MIDIDRGRCLPVRNQPIGRPTFERVTHSYMTAIISAVRLANRKHGRDFSQPRHHSATAFSRRRDHAIHRYILGTNLPCCLHGFWHSRTFAHSAAAWLG